MTVLMPSSFALLSFYIKLRFPLKTKEQAEGDAKLEEALVGSKLESVLQEYNDMLTRTLDDQRKFFEDRIASLQQQWDAERQVCAYAF